MSEAREQAIRAMRRFEKAHGLPEAKMFEISIENGGGFSAIAPDGREYTSGWEDSPELVKKGADDE